MSVLSLEQRVTKFKGEKSDFNRNFVHSTTGRLGELIPVMVEEVLPNDYYKVKMSHILNMLPLAGKLQANVDCFLHLFFVPNRVIQQNFKSDLQTDWNSIITGRTEQTVPQANLKNHTIETDSIGNYLGIPCVSPTEDILVSQHPLYAYMQIYNDYYRNKVIDAKLDKDDLTYWSPCLKRNWRRDYFTSCVPTPQFGDASRVQLDIEYLSAAKAFSGVGTFDNTENIRAKANSADETDIETATLGAIGIKNIDLAASGIDVNEIRFAYAYQDWLVRILQSGDDYAEHLKNIFGVESSDKRLQRAEYLGGYNSPVIVNDVLQANPVYDSTDVLVSPMGTQGGTAYTYGNSDTIETYIEEHGYLMAICSITPKTTYYGGLPRMFKRFSALDFYFPQFAYLPEQEVKMYEIALQNGDNNGNDATFGYIERNAEYKHRNDMFSGQMCKEWTHLHFGRLFNFGFPVSLNAAFLKCEPREDAFAVARDIHFFGQFAFQLDANRLMPFNVDSLTL